ncbi:LacI family DNA-binding transcriptional regulator [Dictyobacter kobayashii]|uniref:LacI family transcriptional regulator n=1 Tax=Dictyobacter kobayashii TaxID=2014872 RepID=A0A402AV06_9CHLR|nr:LacI family DNA-binding transcriptional regulator [Dictyobacter kobayashii]GCE22924.1 LacI family transcriptional regulator [Dictyobacter kobayashii]
MTSLKQQSETGQTADGRSTQSVTIHDVARAAGVTISTVSKALNGQGKLRAETRERVQEVARSLGFRPNDLVQSLIRGSTSTIGFITSDSEGRFSIPLLSGINNVLMQEQISVFLCDTSDDVQREQQHIDLLLAKRVDGFIVSGWKIDARPPLNVGNNRTPIVYACAQVKTPEALCLIPDDEQGGRIAVEHLLQLGRRSIAHITGLFQYESVQSRERGMRQALDAYGVPHSPNKVLSGPWGQRWGYGAARLLLDDPENRRHLDAIFCGSDQIACGVIDALHERGVRVPDDIAIVGFDNWDIFATESRPALTSVNVNLPDLGRQAAQRLLAMIKGGEEQERGIIRLPCSLVVRESSGASLEHLKEN